jgi:hypothetical protein
MVKLILVTDVINDILTSHILHWFLPALATINEEWMYKSLAKQPMCRLQNQALECQTLNRDLQKQECQIMDREL